MAAHPGEYRWSSYRANAQGEADALLSPHALYLAMDKDDALRQAAYRELFRHQLDPGAVDAIRQATNGNYALGDARFAEDIAKALGRRVLPGASGRPRKEREQEMESEDLFK
jgi:putative transposase